MKIVNICGGLGNQMFQYAFAQALKEKFPNDRVLVDTHHYRSILPKKLGYINLHNGVELYKIFPNLTINKAGFFDIIKLSYYMPDYYVSRLIRKFIPKRHNEFFIPAKLSFHYAELAKQIEGDCYYEGYWQSLKYFDEIKPIIQNAFTFSNPTPQNRELALQLAESESVAIHVRRGDYINHPIFGGICEMDYYMNALQELRKTVKECHFFIFSNDIIWCKNNLEILLYNAKITYVTHNTGKNSYWDMYLMSKSSHLILSNSSFCWWAAYLNNNAKSVYVPSQWANTKEKIDLYLEHWTPIPIK